MNYLDPTELEPFLRQRIAEGHEHDKLDFKLTFNLSATDEKANIVRLVNAFANTYALEFDDYGFLIFGVDMEKRGITQDVAVLRTKGTDKLDAEIGQQLEKYIYPSPAFQLFSFEEADVGKWGCLMLYPNQNPPFIFKREYTGKVSWRVGEWRVRRNKKVMEPNADDYGRAMQGRIQSAIQPLQRELTSLRDELRRVEGRLENMQGLGQPQLKVGFLEDEELSDKTTLLYTPALEAGRRELVKQQKSSDFEKHLGEIRADKRNSDVPNRDYHSATRGWVTLSHRYVPSDDEKRLLKAAQSFLNEWDYKVSEEDTNFSKAWVGNAQYSRNNQLFGPDARRLESLRLFLASVENVKLYVNEASRVGVFVPLDLYICNSPGTAAKAVHVTLTVSDSKAINLYEYVPRPRSHIYNENRPDGRLWHQEYSLEEHKVDFDILRPSERQSLGELALKVLKPGEHTLSIRILADNLPEEQNSTLTLILEPE